MSITIKDFMPYNDWKPYLDGEKWDCCDEHRGLPMFIIDQTTGRGYLNQSQGCVRLKCSLLILGTPVVHAVASVINVAYRILKLVTLFHFWIEKEDEARYNFKARLADAGKDLAKVVAVPFSIVGLELSAIYGMFRPYDGRKLYASIERVTYDGSILAPCFQPDPQSHLLHGSLNSRNAW